MIVRFVRIRCLIWFDGNFLPVGGMVAKVEDNWRGGAGQSTENMLSNVDIGEKWMI